MKHGGLLVFLLLLSVVAAQEALDAFDLPGLISPPQIPDIDQETEGLREITFILQDTEGNALNQAHISIQVSDGTNNVLLNTLLFSRDGSITFKVEDISTKAVLTADLLETPGFDGYTTVMITTQDEQTITLFPVGSVRGTVTDRDGQLIADADIKAECQGSYGEAGSMKTDDYGSFIFNILPVGSCRFSARADQAVGFETVDITKGSLDQIELSFSRSAALRNLWPYLFIVLLALGGWALFVWSMRRAKNPVPVAEKPLSEGPSRADDIVKTLREPEQEVVQTLLSSGNEATQAAVYHKTGIPKTTLSRCIQTLEAKQIISVKKIGKMKRLTLTPWFLGTGNKKAV
ncbi:MAG: carboxypeptidase regulatory-like domain-containing protein [Nanoarchaeota archaeon]